MAKQVKSKQRVADHGEVFTAQREVDAMCDLVKYEIDQIDSRFLEPACGDGNFLATILTRKLAIVRKKSKKSAYDWERFSLIALGSLYGVDILLDNAIACRRRLLKIWEKEYKSFCKKECNDETRETAQFILRHNIVCGNALTLRCVDENGEDMPDPIVFSEWTFVSGPRMQRTDYTFAELLAVDDSSQKNDLQQESLFDDTLDDGGVFLQKYTAHYRKIYEDDPAWRAKHPKQLTMEEE